MLTWWSPQHTYRSKRGIFQWTEVPDAAKPYFSPKSSFTKWWAEQDKLWDFAASGFYIKKWENCPRKGLPCILSTDISQTNQRVLIFFIKDMRGMLTILIEYHLLRLELNLHTLIHTQQYFRRFLVSSLPFWKPWCYWLGIGVYWVDFSVRLAIFPKTGENLLKSRPNWNSLLLCGLVAYSDLAKFL